MPKSKSSKRTKPRRGFRKAANGLLPHDGKVFSYITDVPRAPSRGLQVFRLTQTSLISQWHSTSVSVPTFNNVSFYFSQIDQYADLSAVFDQYRIDSVEVYISTEASNLNMTNSGRLITVIDFDDATNLTAVAQAEDYATAITSSCQSNQYRHFVPRMAVGAFSGTFVGFANTRPQWIDAASPGVFHYGVKLACTPTSTAINLDLTIRYNLSFRSVR